MVLRLGCGKDEFNVLFFTNFKPTSVNDQKTGPKETSN